MKQNKTSRPNTLALINEALGQMWFERGNVLEPGEYIIYSSDDNSDVVTIRVKNVIAAWEEGAARKIAEFIPNEKDEEIPDRLLQMTGDELDQEQNADDSQVQVHYLDKWQARGSLDITIKYNIYE
jgi:hypothetical protein